MPKPKAVSLEDVTSLLESLPMSMGNEKQMQQAVARALIQAGIPFEPEVILSPKDRIDFLLSGGIGIEVKNAGSYSAVALQLLRYAEADQVESLILLTSRAAHRQLHGLANQFNIPVHVCFTGFYGF